MERMGVVLFRQKRKWGYKVKRGNLIVGRGRRLYPTKTEAFTIGKNHKQSIISSISPITGRSVRKKKKSIFDR